MEKYIYLRIYISSNKYIVWTPTPFIYSGIEIFEKS